MERVCPFQRSGVRVKTNATGHGGYLRLVGPPTMSAAAWSGADALAYADRLYNLGRRLTGNDADAEELVQETYVRALAGARTFTGGNLKAWLFKILSNTAISRFRHLSHEQGDTSLDDMGEFELYGQAVGNRGGGLGESAEEQALNQILDIDVRHALEELPEPFRLAVLLSDVEGFSYKEIADVLDVPLGTVMSRLFRGRRMLRSRLEEYARSAPRPSEGASS